MFKRNLLRKAAPCILSLVVAATSLPTAVMASDLDTEVAVEDSAESDEDLVVEEEPVEETEESAVASEEEASTSTSSNASDEEDDDYVYCYASLTWSEYWYAEGVYNATDTSSSDETDGNDEYDCGGYDTVTRATTNHGPWRQSFQTWTDIVCEDGSTYEISYFYDSTDKTKLELRNGEKVTLTGTKKSDDGTAIPATLTLADGTVKNIDHFAMKGIRYVPVAVKAEDYDDFASKYEVTTNGTVISGGSYAEGSVKAYENLTVDVDANTNGLKEAIKQEDGTYTFANRDVNSGSGIENTDLIKITDLTPTIKSVSQNQVGSFGEFIRVDFNGADYGLLGGRMQAVKWEYYGDDASRSDALVAYGTKFEADNWMHSRIGIQLGLTESARCKLPAGTDGTGYWRLTIYALGCEDYTYDFELTSDNILEPTTEASDTSELAAYVAKLEKLNKADYTSETWADLATELEEAKELLAKESPAQPRLNEQVNHLQIAEDSLVEITRSMKLSNTSKNIYKGKSFTLKATVSPSATVTYTSSNKKVATVSSKGVIKGVKAGTATITVSAKIGSKTIKKTCKVTVKNPVLKLSKSSATIKVGKKTTIKAKATPSAKVTYKSSNKKVASVSSKGVVKGLKKGKATIYVKANGVTKKFKVTVK